MSREAHTAGPWTTAYRDDLAFRFGTEDAWEVMGETHGVAIVPGSEANARLIAAAPALLQAAMKAESIIDDFLGHLSPDEQAACAEDPEAAAALKALRAAIQSATGEG